MAKYYGMVGYVDTVETTSGVWRPVVTERPYYGDVIRNIRRFESPDKVNGDIKITNEISIVADPYAIQNFHAIRYLEYLGTNWEVTSVTVEYPRLRLSIGGVYHGERPVNTP